MADENLDREKMRLDHELGRYGLKGTLFGTVAALIVVVIIGIAQIVTGRNVVSEWAFTALVGIIVVPVIMYGAFVFNRVISIEGKYKDAEFKTRSGQLGPARDSPPPS